MTYTDEQIRSHRLTYLEALESGEYPQTTNALTRLSNDKTTATGHCCLGVACEVALKDGVHLNLNDDRVGTPEGSDTYVRTYDGAIGYLPTAVIEWLGVTRNDPVVANEKEGPITAIAANDTYKWSFIQIAAALRKLWNLPKEEPTEAEVTTDGSN